LKYRIKDSHGIASISALAAATAQKKSTIKIGIEWLEAHGYLSVEYVEDDETRVHVGDKTRKKDSQKISTLLNIALDESAAFRRYFLKADKNHLLFFD
jgi:DNA-binding MarR family transcriptional regulator